ncbi:MAG: HAD-IA family hydrolase, partial [Planctomycetes bacterium]|nr:HAD-IA family hydrolase [Planctomycetota bacterium]
MSALQGIFFDVDDTLFSTTGFAETARRRSLKAMIQLGLRVEPEALYRDLIEVISEFSSNYGNHYDKLLSRLPRHTLEGLSPSLLVAAAVAAYHDTKFRELSAYEDVLRALRLLAGTNLTLGIITSGLRIKQAEKLIRLRIWPYIDPRAVFITDEIGIGKPNPKLYLRACETMRLDPARTMYVGDHPLNDVHASNQAGMISVWNRREGRHLSDPRRSEP